MPFSADELNRLLLPLPERPRVLVALSGGPDSTALLRRLVELDVADIAAAHINHNLRGDESAADAAFCANLCTKLDIEYHSASFDSNGASDESTLRNARYALLLSIAKEHNYKHVATGHTLDDQAETLLFRLFRGTSPSGLKGIQLSRLLSPGIYLIRPMLKLRRSDVIKYLDDLSQNYRTDSSNLVSNYSRNYLRNEVLPRISEKFGDVIPRLEQLREMLAQDEQVLDELTETRAAAMFSTQHSCPLKSFLSEPISLQRRILADELRARDVEVSAERVASILQLATTGGAITLSAEWRIVVKDAHIFFEQMSDEDEFEAHTSHVERTLQTGLNIIPELGCAIRVTPQKQSPSGFPAATSDEALVTLTNATMPLIARRRRPGDVIKPFGMTENVRLKRYLQTHRRADGTHAGHPVVVATNEEIIWVPGVGLSNSARVAPNTIPTYHLEFMHLSSDELPFA
jgi:tRNA(Ile)-lysidine synthase